MKSPVDKVKTQCTVFMRDFDSEVGKNQVTHHAVAAMAYALGIIRGSYW